MSLELINLNDAIYRLMHPQMMSYDVFTPNDFNEVNCPLLQNFNSKSVVTYGDFVKMLGGDPTKNANDVRYCGRTRWQNTNGYPYSSQSYGYWGKTFGKYKGKNGKPLCETKPLDSFYFHYDVPNNFGRWSLWYGDNGRGWVRNNGSNYNSGGDGSDSCLYRVYVDDGRWIVNWAYVGRENGYEAPLTLSPGLYVAVQSTYSWHVPNRDWSGSNTFTYINGNYGVKENIICACSGDIVNTGGLWKTTNQYFFVDSPIRLQNNWHTYSSRTYFMWMLYRITPPGYWE